ncbi:MAG: 5'-3' exonuclease H3TH domain-containing protein [Verrucomicrobiota bacterium JB022]|nr:5'-3' exonuclease H3TH domain-containing protein [Verrucomicrobiota bacterium JB022]
MKFALIDGYNLAFRAFYGLPELTRADGFPTGALHGWVRTLWWVDDNVGADRLVVFFDLGEPTRHTTLQADYKAQRTETPAPLKQQIPYIKQWTRGMGYLGVEKDGVEADDLIASYCKHLTAEGHEVVIVSADKDLTQLVNNEVMQWMPPPTANPRLGWRQMDEAAVEAKFGVPPKMIPDYLALVGDTSDNIPGIAGVGPKTAAKWLLQYKSVEGVIQHCGELNPKRFQGLVHAGQNDLRRNLQMTTLDCTQPIEPLGEGHPDADLVINLLTEMGMTRSADEAVKRFAKRQG